MPEPSATGSATPVSPLDPERAEFIAGLRALADHYERTDQQLPFSRVVAAVIENDPGRFAAEVRTMGGDRSKQGSDEIYRVGREFGSAIRLEVVATRSNVCTAVVVGTETYVEHEVIDTRPVTKTRDIIEWRCAPILEGAGQQ